MWLHWDDPAWGFQDCCTTESARSPTSSITGSSATSARCSRSRWPTSSGCRSPSSGSAGPWPTCSAASAARPCSPWPRCRSTTRCRRWGVRPRSSTEPRSLLFLALGLGSVAGRFWAGTLTGAALYFVHPIGLAAWIGMAPLVARGWWRRPGRLRPPAAVLFVVGMLLRRAGSGRPAPASSSSATGGRSPTPGSSFPASPTASSIDPRACSSPGLSSRWWASPPSSSTARPGASTGARSSCSSWPSPTTWRCRGTSSSRWTSPASPAASRRWCCSPRCCSRCGARCPPATALLVPLLGLNVWHGAYVADKLAHGRSDERAFHRIVD